MGGLGLREAKNHNVALMSKLGWKLLCKDNCLWVRVLESKYLKNVNFLSYSGKRSSSHIWRGVLKTRDVLRNCIKWGIGDGTEVRIWHDWWCGEATLASQYQNWDSINMETVDNLMTDEGEWDVDSIKSHLPNEAIDSVLKVKLPRFVTFSDFSHWKGSTSGEFSTVAVYKSISNQGDYLCDMDWVWKLKIPQKLKGFLWLVFNGKLLTNAMRMRRGFTGNANCPRCDSHVENIEHLLRDCYSSRILWTNLKGRHWFDMESQYNLIDWLTKNLRFPISMDPSWSLLFAVTIWQLWKERNRKVFDNIDPSWQNTLVLIHNYVNEIKQAFLMSLSSQTSVPILIKWLPPPTGKIKLNTDGSARGDPGEGGFGGVFRDETGIWLSGYFGKLDSCSSLEVEMWGLYRGLTIVLEKGLHEVIIEIDSSLAENLLIEGPLQNCSFCSIVEDSRHLIRRCNCTIHSIRREGNKCADVLAKMGSNQMDQLVVMEEPPTEVRSQLVADMIGTAYRRV